MLVFTLASAFWFGILTLMKACCSCILLCWRPASFVLEAGILVRCLIPSKFFSYSVETFQISSYFRIFVMLISFICGGCSQGAAGRGGPARKRRRQPAPSGFGSHPAAVQHTGWRRRRRHTPSAPPGPTPLPFTPV